MRTQALRVSIGAYSNGAWHVALIRDDYERGVLVNSSIESLRHTESYLELEGLVLTELRRIWEIETPRSRAEAAGATRPDQPAASLR